MNCSISFHCAIMRCSLISLSWSSLFYYHPEVSVASDKHSSSTSCVTWPRPGRGTAVLPHVVYCSALSQETRLPFLRTAGGAAPQAIAPLHPLPSVPWTREEKPSAPGPCMAPVSSETRSLLWPRKAFSRPASHSSSPLRTSCEVRCIQSSGFISFSLSHWFLKIGHHLSRIP